MGAEDKWRKESKLDGEETEESGVKNRSDLYQWEWEGVSYPARRVGEGATDEKAGRAGSSWDKDAEIWAGSNADGQD